MQLTSTRNVAPHRTTSPGDPCPQASGSSTTGANNGADFEILGNIFAGFLIRQQMLTTPASEMMGRVTNGHAGFAPSGTQLALTSNPIKKQGILRRQTAHQFSEARRYEAFLLLGLLPYLQGVILYILAVSYPFFAMMLLLPGHAAQFFMWMALWAWAKSWDVGWAAVIVADEILWQLMPKSAFINPANPAPYTSPVSLLEGAYDGDHSYTLATYWMLVSAMISGVPIITAQAIIGSKKAIAGIMLKGITDVSDQISSSASDYIGGAQVRGYTSARERSGASDVLTQSSQMFTSMAHNMSILQQNFSPKLLDQVVQGVGATGGAKESVRDYYGAKIERMKLTMAGKGNTPRAAELDAQMKGLADGKMKDELARIQQVGQQFSRGGGVQGAQELEAILGTHGVGPVVSHLLFGKQLTPKQTRMWRDRQTNAQIFDALQGDKKDLPAGPEYTAQNDQLQGLMEEQQKQLHLQAVYANDNRHWAQMKMLSSVPLAGFGYGKGGAPLAGILTKGTVNNAMVSQSLAYAHQHRLADLEMKSIAMYNEWMFYETNKSPGWVQNENFRAYASQNRGEWFILRSPNVNGFLGTWLPTACC